MAEEPVNRGPDAKVLPFTERLVIFGMLISHAGYDCEYRASGVLAPKIACSVSFSVFNAELTLWDIPDKAGTTVWARAPRADGARERKLFGTEVRRLEATLLAKIDRSLLIDPEVKRLLHAATKKVPNVRT